MPYTVYNLLTTKLRLLCIFVMALLHISPSVVWTCDIHGFQACDNMKNLVNFKIILDLPGSDVESTCERWRATMQCAYQDWFVGGCAYREIVMVHSVESVRKYLCKKIPDTYRKSSACFKQDGLQAEVGACIKGFERARSNMCGALENPRYCARTVVENRESCNARDKAVMGQIVDHLLKPFADPQLLNCDMPDIEGEEKIEEDAMIEEEEVLKDLPTTEMTVLKDLPTTEMTTTPVTVTVRVTNTTRPTQKPVKSAAKAKVLASEQRNGGPKGPFPSMAVLGWMVFCVYYLSL